MSAPLLQVRQVNLSFGGPLVLEQVSFSLEPAERLCLIGRNGSGKSSLLKVITGELLYESGDVITPQGTKIAALAQKSDAADNRKVFEVVASGLGELSQCLTRYEQLSEQSEHDEKSLNKLADLQGQIEHLGGWNLYEQCTQLLRDLKLDPHGAFSDLSGGQQRRVLLAKALISRPDILILDEPTNHLDIPAIEALESFLLKQKNLSVLFVSHDRQFINRIATGLIELDRGDLLRYQGGYDDFQAAKEAALAVEEKTRREFDKKLADEEAWLRRGVKARRARNEGRVRALKNLRSERSQWRSQGRQMKLQADADLPLSRRVIVCKGIYYEVEDKPLIQDFSFVLARGDKIGIIGPNGCGKSTLIRLMLKKLQPKQGTIKWGNQLEFAYFDQMREQIDLNATLMDNVGQGSETVNVQGKERHIIGYLQDFLFTPDQARASAQKLSGGEMNRLLLAKLFSKSANVLVLDEPTNDLDIDSLELLETLLVEFTGSVLLISHDRRFIDNVVTSALIFRPDGTLDEIVGGYQNWQTPDPAKVEVKPALEPAVITETTQGASKPKKLSYKLQRELDALPKAIEQLEAQHTELQANMASAEFYTQARELIVEANEQLAVLEQQVSETYERFEALLQMQEKG